MRFLLLCLQIMCLQTLLLGQNWELDYLRRLETRRTPFKNSVMRTASEVGPYVSLAVPTSVFVAGVIRDNKSLRRKGVTGGIGFGLTVVETYVLKKMIKRPRPAEAYPHRLQPLLHETSYAMPSGHTATAFYTATWITLEYPRWQVAVPAFIGASLISHSRSYVGVHYPTDILAGAALGGLSALGVWLLRH